MNWQLHLLVSCPAKCICTFLFKQCALYVKQMPYFALVFLKLVVFFGLMYIFKNNQGWHTELLKILTNRLLFYKELWIAAFDKLFFLSLCTVGILTILNKKFQVKL